MSDLTPLLIRQLMLDSEGPRIGAQDAHHPSAAALPELAQPAPRVPEMGAQCHRREWHVGAGGRKGRANMRLDTLDVS